MDLPHSDDCFVMAFPAETTEAFLEGHVRAFAYFGGVPTPILYDNTKLAVARILGDGERQKTRAFSELQSHYLFADKFGRPAKGNDKGKVEGLVGYARRNFMVPIPRFASWEELNAHSGAMPQAARAAAARPARRSANASSVTGRLLPLPAAPYEACEKLSARVNSLSLVRYRTNDYSVPTEYGHRQVLVKGYVHEVVIACGSEVIARHAAVMNAKTWSSIRCITWRCWNRRPARWIRPHRWPAGSCRSASPAAAAVGSSAEEARQPGVRAGAAADGDLLYPGSSARHRRRAAPGHDQLRRREASAAVPHRAEAAAAGHGELSAPAAGRSAHHAGRRLHALLSPSLSLPSEVTR